MTQCLGGRIFATTPFGVDRQRLSSDTLAARMSETESDPVRVFISYSHDSAEHRDRILALANRMRGEGIDCRIDRFVESPSEGWPLWMQDQIEQADAVLVVCTETYERRASGKEVPGRGLGARWEGAIIMQQLYERVSSEFVPVVVSGADVEHIPVWLAGQTYYDLSSSDGYERLYRRLTGQPEVLEAPLGSVRAMPPIEAKWEPDTLERPLAAVPQAEPEPAGHGETGLGEAPSGEWQAPWFEAPATTAPQPPAGPAGAAPLAQILPGMWAIQIASQFGQWQGGFALAPTGYFQGQLHGPQGGVAVDGMWQVAPPAQVVLQGRQGTPMWVNPFQLAVAFAQVQPGQLAGTTHRGEQTIWTRTG